MSEWLVGLAFSPLTTLIINFMKYMKYICVNLAENKFLSQIESNTISLFLVLNENKIKAIFFFSLLFHTIGINNEVEAFFSARTVMWIIPS